MGGIWSQQSTQDDEEDTNSVESSESETEVAENEVSATPVTQPTSPVSNEKTNNTTPNSNERRKYTSYNLTRKSTDDTGNNDDNQGNNNNNNKTTAVHKLNNQNINNVDKQEEWQPTTRQWRSNSARGLKRVDLQNVNILVVDDDAVQRAVLRKWLHDEKYKNGILNPLRSNAIHRSTTHRSHSHFVCLSCFYLPFVTSFLQLLFSPISL